MNRRVEMVPATTVPGDKMTEVKVLVRDVMFTGSSSDLSSDGMKFLDDVAAAFHGDNLKDLRLKVIGSASGANAASLARSRAEAAARYLGSKGVDSARIDVSAEPTGGNKVEVMPVGP